MAITAMPPTTLPPIAAAFEPLSPADGDVCEEGEGVPVASQEAVGFEVVPVELVVLEINAPGPISGLSK